MKTAMVTEHMLTQLCEVVLVTMQNKKNYEDISDEMDIGHDEMDLIIEYCEAVNNG